MFLTFVALLFLVLGTYDISTGALSEIWVHFLGLPGNSEINRKMSNYVSLLLATGLLIYSFLQIWQHGWFNQVQYRMMLNLQYFLLVILIVLMLCAMFSLIASHLYLRGTGKGGDDEG